MHYKGEKMKKPLLILLICLLCFFVGYFAGMKSKHDDWLDTVSMLANLTPWRPNAVVEVNKNSETNIWEAETVQQSSNLTSYIV